MSATPLSHPESPVLASRVGLQSPSTETHGAADDTPLSAAPAVASRLGGITVLAWWNGIGGGVMMLVALAAPNPAAAGALFLFGALSIGLGVGLHQLRPGARWTAIGCYGLNVLVSLATTNVIGLFVSSCALGYLFSDRVTRAFRAGGEGSELAN